MLIEIGWRFGIDENNSYFLGCKVRAMLYKVMHLLHAVRAMIPGGSLGAAQARAYL